MNALQVVRHIGARVIVLDTRQSCLDTAKCLGVPTDDIVPVGVGAEDFLKNKGPETRIDTVLDFVGKHETFEAGQHIGEPSHSRILAFAYGLQFGEVARSCALEAWTQRTPSI